MMVTQISLQLYQDYSCRQDEQPENSIAVTAGKTLLVDGKKPVSELSIQYRRYYRRIARILPFLFL